MANATDVTGLLISVSASRKRDNAGYCGQALLFRRSSPDGDIETAAQLVMQSRRRCNGHLYFRLPTMKLLKTRNQPANGECGRSADAKDVTH